MVRWVAVFIGWVVDIGGTNVFAIVFFGWLFASGQLSAALANDPKALSAALIARPELFTVSILGGTFFSFLGGYVAARVAGRAFVLHGALSSLACLASDVLSAEQLLQMPLWLAALGVVLAPAAGAFGGYVRQLQARTAQPTLA